MAAFSACNAAFSSIGRKPARSTSSFCACPTCPIWSQAPQSIVSAGSPKARRYAAKAPRYSFAAAYSDMFRAPIAAADDEKSRKKSSEQSSESRCSIHAPCALTANRAGKVVIDASQSGRSSKSTAA